ncbi:hypothetical protein IB223_01920 [Pseudoxanthomonas sp. PXM03]|jgi:hypothetical protein|uniref:hypothetical protein n=1 Tax=Pseudoxanthomonas sp. PXM03 TaxID=2769284 RepID=UPI00177D4AC7|nr:hypothetical protein [Pseudoxanthomonas sp. PXM03]MBD9434836.1 hypothetical protein [Pseudoxanthomonas sp. PXM03]
MDETALLQEGVGLYEDVPRDPSQAESASASESLTSHARMNVGTRNGLPDSSGCRPTNPWWMVSSDRMG